MAKEDDSLKNFARLKGRKYISAVILGLNDALIELTGALAGFTMVLPDNRTIVLAGLTTGVAATLSMAASEYLSQEADNTPLHPLLAACVTGGTYFVTVIVLLIPFIIVNSPFLALSGCVLFAALMIFLFTFFESLFRRQSFIRLCSKMLVISFGVALLSFCISWAADVYWNISV